MSYQCPNFEPIDNNWHRNCGNCHKWLIELRKCKEEDKLREVEP